MDRAVREVFDFVEDNLRFKYVQLGKAYIDLLRQALIENNQEKKSEEIYDFPLSLELGVSSIAGQVFIELGLSREGANKQVISSQADSLIKISRIWADFFPANTSNQPI